MKHTQKQQKIKLLRSFVLDSELLMQEPFLNSCLSKFSDSLRYKLASVMSLKKSDSVLSGDTGGGST